MKQLVFRAGVDFGALQRVMLKDPTIAEKFNRYQFEEYRERVIELLWRVAPFQLKRYTDRLT